MMPVGGICMFPSATPPEGYLLCNGASITIEDYPNLYAIIGHTFDAGSPPINGSFYVPDMRGRFVVGNGQNAGDAVYNINDKGGEQEHVLVADEVGEHTHGIVLTDGGHTHTATATSAEHTHSITDAGHTHAITDPGHTHGGTPNTLGGLYIAGAPDAGRGSQSDSATTGITITSATTGVVVDNASVAVSVNISSATTGLSAVVGTTDTAVGHENRPPYIALAYIIRAL
jgi:microcystin-dependent protein